jgi:hypothetical protein
MAKRWGTVPIPFSFLWVVDAARKATTHDR